MWERFLCRIGFHDDAKIDTGVTVCCRCRRFKLWL